MKRVIPIVFILLATVVAMAFVTTLRGGFRTRLAEPDRQERPDVGSAETPEA